MVLRVLYFHGTGQLVFSIAFSLLIGGRMRRYIAEFEKNLYFLSNDSCINDVTKKV